MRIIIIVALLQLKRLAEPDNNASNNALFDNPQIVGQSQSIWFECVYGKGARRGMEVGLPIFGGIIGSNVCQCIIQYPQRSNGPKIYHRQKTKLR
jgi:hypothetical protein